MKRKGFTLVELLGVIIILGILVLIAFPPIINQIRLQRESISEATLKVLYSATEKYMNENKNEYPITEDTVYCIPLQTLADAGKIQTPIIDAKTGNEIALTKEIYVDIFRANNITYSLVKANTCGYIDPSGAKTPVLSDNMIPVIRSNDNTKWLKADVNSAWYSYREQKWANAVLVTSQMRARYNAVPAGTEVADKDVLAYLVWIPRYRYRIFNSSALATTAKGIEIIFEGKRTTKSNGLITGDWLTHPAFSFGNIQVDGFWVGKFETTGTSTDPVIKPNQVSLKVNDANAGFAVSQKFNTATFGLTSTNYSHTIKNTEWGAIAYLSQSAYGKYGNTTYTGSTGLEKEIWKNPNSNTITGCAGTTVNANSTIACNVYTTENGVKASTTGNVYGVYDMSGSTDEYVMGAQFNVNNINIAIASSGFGQSSIDDLSMEKYIDKYIYGNTNTDQAAFNRRILGDATGETRGWNGDYASFVGINTNTNSWFTRGGAYNSSGSISGIFNFSSNNGSGSLGLRIVILGD